MAYKSILLHLDSSKACETRVRAAVAMAEAQDGHLIGLFPTAEPTIPTFVGASLPADILEQQAKQALDQADAGLNKFAKACKAAGISYEERKTRCYHDEVTELLALHGRYADVLVMGQADPDDPLSPSENLLQDTVLAVGRPVLAVPYIGFSRPPGERVAIAWDSGREAARAVNDALPMLSKAKSVIVLVINPKIGAGAHGEQPGSDIATYLARHGVKVEVQQSETPDISVGDSLLSRLSDLDCDLLVMGAYGHSRLRQVILGGVTRTLFEQMTVPVLLTH